MSKNHDTYHIIKDPVHGSMQFTDAENSWIKPFIDSHNFQRLRHIKQLGLGDLIFPGAVHTRFNHAIGCCYVSEQITRKLSLDPEDRKVVMLACLLHDIGHGPFSHAFEGIFYKKSIQHEDWTPLFLNEYARAEFLDQFNRENKKHPLTIRQFNTIKNLIMHKETRKKLLADIVSSQLDADRLDYLRRDSHFCGVKYGEYDFRWLLHCLTIVPDKNKQNRLGITSKGIGVVEHYLMARRLMMRNIYHHGKKYAAEFLLSTFLQHLALGIDSDHLFEEVKDKNLARFLIAAREYNKKAKVASDLTKLKKAFLKENYSLYKHLCDYDVFSMIRYFAGLEVDHSVVKIARRLYSRQLPKVIHIDKKQVKQTREFVKTLKSNSKIEKWQFALIELPHQSYQGSRDPILVLDKTNQIRNIHDDSLVISGLSDKYESSYIVFVDRSILSDKAVKQFFKNLNK